MPCTRRAFFVRCVVDASALRPTASREGLYEDEVLLAARDALGAQVRRWTLDTLAEDAPVARRFLETHHLAVRALALQDDEMLDVAARVLPFETTAGTGSLADLAAAHPSGRLVYTTSVEEYRRIAPVAAAQGLPVVNGGYVYDADLLARAARRFPEWRLAPVTTDDVAHVLTPVEPLRELEITDALTSLGSVLADQDCDVELRRFAPDSLPAMLLHDRDGDHARSAARTAAESDDVWGGILAGLTEPARARRLVLNDDNPTVRALLASPPPWVKRHLRELGTAGRFTSGIAVPPLALFYADVAAFRERWCPDLVDDADQRGVASLLGPRPDDPLARRQWSVLADRAVRVGEPPERMRARAR